MIRRALSLALVAALVLVPTTALAARKLHLAALAVTPEIVVSGDPSFGGSATFTVTVDPAIPQVELAVTCDAVHYDVWRWARDGDYASLVQTRDFPGLDTAWAEGGADCTASLQVPSYVFPPDGSDRTWTEIASTPFTVAP